jgi:hypothetical protein
VLPAERGRDTERDGRQERFARELHDERSQGSASLAVNAQVFKLIPPRLLAEVAGLACLLAGGRIGLGAIIVDSSLRLFGEFPKAPIPKRSQANRFRILRCRCQIGGQF